MKGGEDGKKILVEQGRTNGWNLKPDKCKLERRCKLVRGRMINHWNKLPREVVDSPALDVSNQDLLMPFWEICSQVIGLNMGITG